LRRGADLELQENGGELMIPNATAGLITALKNSLADADAAWVVTGIDEGQGTRIASVTPSASSATFVTPAPPLGSQGTAAAVTGVGVAVNSATTVVTQIDLLARALVQSDGSAGLVVSYLSVWIDGAFDHGIIHGDGGAYKSTDAALDTTIRSKGSTFNTAKDTALLDALEAGPQTGVGEQFIASDVLDDLKASLADEDAGWAVTALNTTKFGRDTLTAVVLQAANVAMPVGTTLRAQVSYSARSVGAVLIEASVSIRGSQWRVVDADLHATMMALADAFRETQGAAFAEALA
jgi:hypothetical protein